MATNEMKVETERRVALLDAVNKRVAEVAALELRVGMATPQAKLPHIDRDGERSGMTVEELATIHEFGVSVPERSFVRSVLHGSNRKISAQYVKGLQGAIAGRGSADAGLTAVGKTMAEDMRRKLLHGLTPPLAESTLANPERDPRGLPLVDTEQILDAIGFEVRRG